MTDPVVVTVPSGATSIVNARSGDEVVVVTAIRGEKGDPGGGPGGGIALTNLSATAPLSYNNLTGVFSLPGVTNAGQVQGVAIAAPVTPGHVATYNGTSIIWQAPPAGGGIALTNLSATAPLSYNNLTGVFSLPGATNANQIQGVPIAAPVTAGHIPTFDGTSIIWQAPPAGGGGGIALTNLSATAPLSYNNATGVFSLPTPISIANGGTGATTVGGALLSLGLAIGVNVQGYDDDLDTIAALAKTAGNFIKANGTAWTSAPLVAGDIPVHNQAWSTITARPTTISGYGITDALATSTTFTGDQALATPANTGTITQLFSWVMGRIKAITGAANWFDAPATTLAAAAAHFVNTGNPHNTTAAQVGNTTAQWNANRIQGFPIATPSTVGHTPTFDGTSIVWQAPSGGGGGISLTSLSATAPLSYNNVTGVFSLPVATASLNGYLSSADWNNFNNKASLAGATFTGTVVLPIGSATVAPLRILPGSILLTTPVSGTIENNGVNLFYTNNANARQTIAFTDSNITGTAAGLSTALLVSSGGTGGTTSAAARTNLGVPPIASPTFTGTPAAPTPTPGNSSTQLATTQFISDLLRVSVPDSTVSILVAANGESQLTFGTAEKNIGPIYSGGNTIAPTVTGFYRINLGVFMSSPLAANGSVYSFMKTNGANPIYVSTVHTGLSASGPTPNFSRIFKLVAGSSYTFWVGSVNGPSTVTQTSLSVEFVSV